MLIEDGNALKRALHEMCERLRADMVPEAAVFDCKVVAHELIENALQYGGGKAYFSYERAGRELRVTVRSEISFRPPDVIVRADVEAERGRGLYLVDALSASRKFSEKEGICAIIEI